MTESSIHPRLSDVVAPSLTDRPVPYVTPRVKLADIVFVLETQTDAVSGYLDRVTGEVHVVTDEDRSLIDWDEAEVADWQRPNVRIAREVEAGNDRYVQLPTRFDIDDYAIMASFCRSQRSVTVRERLTDAISGKGAFRMFRDAIRRLEMQVEWERYRIRELERVAVDWCRERGFELDVTDVPGIGSFGGEQELASHRDTEANADRLLNEPVYTHVTWRALPGHEEEFLAAWNVLGDLFVRLEHPPIEVTLIRRVDDPTIFQSIGSWRSLSDAQAVSDVPEAIDALARIASLCADGAPSVYEVVRRIRPDDAAQ